MNNRNIISKAPKLRFPDFDSEWSIKSLGDLCTEVTYGLTVRPEYIEEGIPLISAREIAKGYIDFYNAPKISQKSFDALSDKAKPKKDDLFLSKTGTIGFSAYVNRNNFAITQNIAVIRPDINKNINPFYLLNYFKTKVFLKAAIRKVNQSTIMDLQLQDIKKLNIAVPQNIDEQEKIADFLNTVDQYIQNLKTQKEELEKYKKGIMQKIFSQEIRFKDDEGNNYPEWEIKKLEQVSKINPSYQKLPDNFIYIDLESVENGVLLKLNKITKGTAPSRAQRVLEKGDILFQTVRPYQKNNLLFNNDGNYVASTGYAQIEAQINNMYLYQYLHTDEFVNKVLARCTGTSYPAINSSDLKTLYIKVPISEEQEKIANVLNFIDDFLNIKNEQIIEMTLWKKGLMQEIFV